MSERVQKNKPVPKKEEVVEEVEPKTSKTAEELKAETDELLDEIDGLLEEDAAAFVAGFIQKGGQLCETIWYNIREGFKLTVLRMRGYNENMRSGWMF